MTARDIQSKAKKLGHPWTFAKGFDTALPISKFIPKAEIPEPDNREFKITMTVTATSLNKRFNEQNNGCTRAL